MARKLIRVWLILTILIFSSISIYADEDVQGEFFLKNLVINGEKIVNYNLQYPFFMYNNTTYIPLTDDMCKICGFTVEMDGDSRTLKLTKTTSTQKQLTHNWCKCDAKDQKVKVVSNIKVVAYAAGQTTKDNKTAAETSSAIGITAGTGGDTSEDAQTLCEELDLGGLPVLKNGNYYYLPIRVFANSELFDWDLHFDPYYGICLSTNSNVSAKSYRDEAEILYNKGLVKFIQTYNSSISTTNAQEMVFLFKRAGTINGVDEKLLMAIAQKESKFNVSATARGGARGLMQIMPDTARGMGVDPSKLYDAKTNIDLGAYYIGQRITAYNGNLTLALSAYNQGSAKVNRGTHSTAYAKKILAAYDSLNAFLNTQGYILK